MTKAFSLRRFQSAPMLFLGSAFAPSNVLAPLGIQVFSQVLRELKPNHWISSMQGNCMTTSSAAVAHVEAVEPDRSHILVVEDELIIRMLISDALRDEGFAVIEAVSADEAVDILIAGMAIDLVFSDVRMPGSIDGLGLLRFVNQRFPELPVVLTSAHLDPSLALAGGAKHFLSKPYKLATVLTMVTTELANLA